MLQILVITMREGIEAFLIVAITAGILRQTGRSALLPALYWGTGLALIVSFVASLFFAQAENKPLWEAILAAAAAVMVASMTIYMADSTIVHTRRAQLWLGTLVDIRAEARSPATLERALAAAFAAIARVHYALSGHDASSELSRVNRNALRSVQRVSADFCAVLECALDVASRSDGTFDPTIATQPASAREQECVMPASRIQPRTSSVAARCCGDR